MAGYAGAVRPGGAAEAPLCRMAEHIPAILWSTDRHLRITSCLGAGLATVNLHPDQAVGMTLVLPANPPNAEGENHGEDPGC